MITRMQLTWSRSKDDNVKRYRVYRSLRPNVSQKDTLVLEVEHTLLPIPVKIVQDKLTWTEDYYLSRYKNIIEDPDKYPVSITFNGIPIESLAIEPGIDGEAGIFYFPHTFSPSDELIATYWIDAIQVLDTDEIKQDRVNYLGPSARDRTESTIPSNLSLLPEPENGRIKLFWKDSMTLGQAYYYRIEAVDEYGNFSLLSPEEGVVIREGLDVEGYIVERSYDGTNWSVVASQAATDYYESGVDTLPPDAVVNLTSQVILEHHFSRGDVHLRWDAPGLGGAAASGLYRVRARTTLGVVSPPSLSVGPVYLSSHIQRYVVRRKPYDGSFPTYDGNDAVTVGIIDSTKQSFVDYAVPDETEYGYAVYAMDTAGNVSIAATMLVLVEDATPPIQVSGFRATTHSYVINTGDTKPPRQVTGVKASRHGYVIAIGDYQAPAAVTRPKASSYYTGI